MMVRNFRNFFKKRNFRKDHKSNKKDDKKKEIICYNCKNSGHIKYDCLEFKDKKNPRERQ